MQSDLEWLQASPLFLIGYLGSILKQNLGYQTWSYFVEIARVAEWLPVLNGTTKTSLSL
jgi:hypothetical protein